MKRHDLMFAAILVPIDYLALLLAGATAYTLRFNDISGILPVANQILFNDYFKFIALIGLAWLLIMGISGAYAVKNRSMSGELGRIFVGSSFAILLLIVTIFFRREYVASRFLVLAGWFFGVIYLWLSHIVVRLVQRWLRVFGVGIHRVVIFGNDQTANILIEAAHGQKSLGITIVKVYPAINLDTLNDFEALIANRLVDGVYIADPNLPKSETIQVLERCNDANVSFSYAADLFETEIGQIKMRDLAGVPIIEIMRTPLDGWGRIIKRAIDMIGAAVLIIIFLIPGLIVAVAIKLDSAGSVFFQAERVGQGMRRFKLWKFRSMVRDAHALKPQLMAQNERHDGPLFKLQNDPRITRVGRFIRKTSLDELPQLFNVLTGSMSLVGPRPHEPEEVARYDRHHKKVLTVKPGMTGMAQVSGRSNLSFEEEVRLDTFYIEHWSINLDMQIFVRTPLAVLNTRTAA